MKKKILSLMLLAALLFPTCIMLAEANFALAAPIEIAPFYTDFSKITPTLSVSGGTATYNLRVTGNKDVTSISATLQLQRYVGGAWSNYGSPWSASSSSSELSTSGTKSVDAGGTYRLKVTVTPYIGLKTGQSETEYS